ncbi:MAG TPA: helix-turn-helix domain-containing protein, partial [Actinomycetota bacterium]
MATTRKYELKKRAEKADETRRRITEATVELHRTVGPAATQITEVARRAGVQRVTVYNHFPNEASLLAACSAHWRSLHPSPDPASWATSKTTDERLRRGLGELYAWYRETEP